MNKRFIALVACVIILGLCLVAFTACDLFGKDGVGIEKIEKTGTEGLVDTYTITLTNGETSAFTVTNGSNGTNVSGVSDGAADDIFFFQPLEDGTYEVYARYHDMPKKVVIPSTYKGKSVTKIAKFFGAFAEDCYNRSVEEIVIPETVTSIGQNSFEGYQALSSVTFPSGLTSIEGYAFYRCIRLTSVTIPSSVMELASYVFSECNSLTTINYGGTMAQWESLGDHDTYYTGYHNKVAVPDGCTVYCADGEITKE